MNNNQQAVLAAFIVVYGEEWEWKKQAIAVSNIPLVLWNLVCVCPFAGHNLHHVLCLMKVRGAEVPG